MPSGDPMVEREPGVTKTEVEDRVKAVTARILKVDKESIRAEDEFGMDLGAESVQSVALVAAFEEEFDIEMDEDAALAVQNVGAAVDFIHRHVQEQHGG
jgi:acyl carrier protein